MRIILCMLAVATMWSAEEVCKIKTRAFGDDFIHIAVTSINRKPNTKIGLTQELYIKRNTIESVDYSKRLEGEKHAGLFVVRIICIRKLINKEGKATETSYYIPTNDKSDFAEICTSDIMSLILKSRKGK